MGHRARCAAVLAIGLTITASLAAADLEGQSAPLAWRATDVQQGTTTVDGQRHARHEFGLTLKNTGADPVTLSRYQVAVSYFGIQMNEDRGTFDATLTPGQELRLPLFMLMACPDDARPCRVSEGPTWRIEVAGRAAGNEFSAPIELVLPADATSPVVRRERVRVTRATPSPQPPAPIPATFKANLVLVAASINGHDLTLLFDTGAQACVLRPEAAKRVGVSLSADGPALPLFTVAGTPGNATLVNLPAVRVGDYIVEHLTGVISSIAGFPIPIDGVLGANFIAAFRVSLDHRAKELRLEPH
jgi:hypothetical protein